MATLIDLAPQIAVALAIIAAALIVNRQVTNMAKGLVGRGKNGEKRSRLEIIEDEVAGHGEKLEKHTKLHNKQFAAIKVLQQGQDDILEHLTNGTKKRKAEDLPDTLDAMDTGQFDVPDELDGVEIDSEPEPDSADDKD